MLTFNGQDLPVTCTLPQHGIVDFIRKFGVIRYGCLTQDAFIYKFNTKIFEILASLVAADDIQRNQSYKIPHIQHNMWMIEAAIGIDQWRWPAMTFGNDDWPTGNSRLLATGYTKIEPWNFLKVLVISHENLHFLSNSVEIISDQQFDELLVNSWDRSLSEPVIFFDYAQKSNRPIDIILKETALVEKENQHFNKYLCWFDKYGPGSPIIINTHWPELITDSFGFWKTYFHSDTSAKFDCDHVLQIAKPFKFDISHLLVWLDLDHDKFIDIHERFVLCLKNNGCKNKRISVATSV